VYDSMAAMMMSPSDDENEHNVRDAKDKRKRGLTRLPKMRSAYTNSGGKKHKVKFDAFGRLSGKYRSEFVSFLGDLVREKVNVSVLTWKEASKELRDKLWEEITVKCLINYLFAYIIFHSNCNCYFSVITK
jgi:hypothetical protein